ncbi:MAG: hypothetical protein RL701_3306 [Pseudomonadota bacterium]
MIHVAFAIQSSEAVDEIRLGDLFVLEGDELSVLLELDQLSVGPEQLASKAFSPRDFGVHLHADSLACEACEIRE